MMSSMASGSEIVIRVWKCSWRKKERKEVRASKF